MCVPFFVYDGQVIIDSTTRFVIVNCLATKCQNPTFLLAVINFLDRKLVRYPAGFTHLSGILDAIRTFMGVSVDDSSVTVDALETFDANDISAEPTSEDDPPSGVRLIPTTMMVYTIKHDQSRSINIRFNRCPN